MYLDRNWRILTVGDGDLSFSLSLVKDKGCRRLVASALDSDTQLRSKYRNNAIDSLTALGVPIVLDFDVCLVDDFAATMYQQFDLVIFQFPLITAQTKKLENARKLSVDTNILNRNLLRSFLHNSRDYLLDPAGQQLSYITSKDVKPYSHWHIEALADDRQDIHFLGTMDFKLAEFDHYTIRNVERDKVVKGTNSETYVFGKDMATAGLKDKLSLPNRCKGDFCKLCGKGPFSDPIQWQQHQNSQMHQRLQKYHQNWLDYLGKQSS